ncbi:hypothetical protein, partial [Xanthomonas campestris]|uniref:hypothetical protein n=1 Tax=Xanthomonas campestris TaxID=339 RepID=UPI004039664E
KIIQTEDGSVELHGVYKETSRNSIYISEIPYKFGRASYVAKVLDALVDAGYINHFKFDFKLVFIRQVFDISFLHLDVVSFPWFPYGRCCLFTVTHTAKRRQQFAEFVINVIFLVTQPLLFITEEGKRDSKETGVRPCARPTSFW